VKIDYKDAIRKGFSTDDSTVDWWGKQTSAVREEAFSGKCSIKEALIEFDSYCESFQVAPLVWGNGADFDNAILAEAYYKMKLPPPWKYSDSRCYRTLKNLYPMVPYTRPTIAHHALYDAQAQAAHAELILAWIKNTRRD